jgi:hypothetical protein
LPTGCFDPGKLLKSLNLLKLDPVFLIILVAASFLLFFHLGHRPFWQDEAETAGLARNVMKYGAPYASDGVNLISQEEGREFGSDYLWRWSPWMQIYLTAAAFSLGGQTTAMGRLPFAFFGLACVWLVYLLVQRAFADRQWARLSAISLAFTVPFLLFSRQCRYYSLGAFLVLLSLYAFQKDWQTRRGPALLLIASLALLFYTNYLLFFSYQVAFLIAAILLYRDKLPRRRTLMLALGTILLILPAVGFFQFQKQEGLFNFSYLGSNLEKYLGFVIQFMLPLPVIAGLAWFWGRSRALVPREPEARFVLFLSLIILGNALLLVPVPQCEFRYLVHLFPLVAVILAWVICRVWQYHKFSGAVLAFLLIFTNWLQVLPMEWLGIINRPVRTDAYMLTYPNIPLKLFLTEICRPYPDTNKNLIQFFRTHARPGETILTTYGDLPLQFYTSCRVLGGLQGRVPSPGERPDWVVKRWDTRWNRKSVLNTSEKFILTSLRLKDDYDAKVLPATDEIYGNRPDPFYHRFVPARHPIASLVIYHLKNRKVSHVP